MAGGRTRGYVKEFEHAIIQETILGVRQIQRLMTFYWLVVDQENKEGL